MESNYIKPLLSITSITTNLILFLIFVLVFLKVLYMCTCKNTLTESFAAAGGKKNCSGLEYISDCEDASDCHKYWSKVPKKGPTGNDMKDEGEPMGCNYDGSTNKCSFKVNKESKGANKVNPTWLCEETPEEEEPEPEPEPDTTPAPTAHPSQPLRRAGIRCRCRTSRPGGGRPGTGR